MGRFLKSPVAAKWQERADANKALMQTKRQEIAHLQTIWGLGFGVWGLGFGVGASGFWVGVLGLGSWVSGFGFRVLRFEIQILGFGFRASGYRNILHSKAERRRERRRRDRERLRAGRLKRGGGEDDRGAVAVDGEGRARFDVRHRYDCHLPCECTVNNVES